MKYVGFLLLMSGVIAHAAELDERVRNLALCDDPQDFFEHQQMYKDERDQSIIVREALMSKDQSFKDRVLGSYIVCRNKVELLTNEISGCIHARANPNAILHNILTGEEEPLLALVASVKYAELLLDNGADVTVKFGEAQQTVLHNVASRADLRSDLLALYLRRDAGVNDRNKYEDAPLDDLVLNSTGINEDAPEKIRWLLVYGALPGVALEKVEKALAKERCSYSFVQLRNLRETLEESEKELRQRRIVMKELLEKQVGVSTKR